jgi:hypothetical protein
MSFRRKRQRTYRLPISYGAAARFRFPTRIAGCDCKRHSPSMRRRCAAVATFESQAPPARLLLARAYAAALETKMPARPREAAAPKLARVSAALCIHAAAAASKKRAATLQRTHRPHRACLGKAVVCWGTRTSLRASYFCSTGGPPRYLSYDCCDRCPPMLCLRLVTTAASLREARTCRGGAGSGRPSPGRPPAAACAQRRPRDLPARRPACASGAAGSCGQARPSCAACARAR